MEITRRQMIELENLQMSWKNYTQEIYKIGDDLIFEVKENKTVHVYRITKNGSVTRK